jgi:hypothetical protein
MARHRERLPAEIVARLQEIRRISKRLRRERELAFYGDEGFDPSEEYDADDSDEAIRSAESIVEWVTASLPALSAGGVSAPHFSKRPAGPHPEDEPKEGKK